MDQSVIPERIGKYNVSRVLGEGAFATVVKAYDTKNYQNVAIKILNRKMIEERKMMEYIEKELRIMSRLNHPSIVKVYEIIYEKDNIYIVMEYMCNGDVFSLLQNGIHLNLKEQLDVAKKIIDGICYLHERGIAHRDINPANILFDESLNPKIADFGLSCESSSFSHTICGTFLFMAPEILKCSKYDARKADVWSLGVVLNIISSNKYPFDNVSQARYVSLVKKDKLIINVENKGIIGQLIKACLVFDPEERISSCELRNLINSHVKDFENHSTKQLFNHSILPKLIAKNSITRNSLRDHLSIRKINTFESNFRMANLASEPMRMSL